jgi:hypothetical protein
MIFAPITLGEKTRTESLFDAIYDRNYEAAKTMIAQGAKQVKANEGKIHVLIGDYIKGLVQSINSGDFTRVEKY